MDCECYFDNPCQAVLADKMLRCRKPTKCCECGTAINRGDRYHRFTGVWLDNGFESFATCERCCDLRKRCDFKCQPFTMMHDVAYQVDRDIEVDAFEARRWHSLSKKSDQFRGWYPTLDKYLSRFDSLEVGEE